MAAVTLVWNNKFVWMLLLIFLCLQMAAYGSTQDIRCSFTDTKTQTLIVSYSPSSRVRYTVGCGFLWLGRCTKYRQVSRIRYRMETNTVTIMMYRCCSGWVQMGEQCIKEITNTTAISTQEPNNTEVFLSTAIPVSVNNFLPSSNTTEADTRVTFNERSSFKPGATSGVIIGCLVIAAALSILIVYVVYKRRQHNQTTSDINATLVTNRTYALTKVGHVDGNGHISDPGINHEAAYENLPREGQDTADDDSSPTNLAGMYAQVQKENSKSHNTENHASHEMYEQVQKETSKSHASHEENVFRETESNKEENGDSKEREGWTENDIYSTSDDDSKVPGNSKDSKEGWVDNSFYSSGGSRL